MGSARKHIYRLACILAGISAMLFAAAGNLPYAMGSAVLTGFYGYMGDIMDCMDGGQDDDTDRRDESEGQDRS